MLSVFAKDHGNDSAGIRLLMVSIVHILCCFGNVLWSFDG